MSRKFKISFDGERRFPEFERAYNATAIDPYRSLSNCRIDLGYFDNGSVRLHPCNSASDIELFQDYARCCISIRRKYLSPNFYAKTDTDCFIKYIMRHIEQRISWESLMYLKYDNAAQHQIIQLIERCIDNLDHRVEHEVIQKSKEIKTLLSPIVVRDLSGDIPSIHDIITDDDLKVIQNDLNNGRAITTNVHHPVTIPAGTVFQNFNQGIIEISSQLAAQNLQAQFVKLSVDAANLMASTSAYADYDAAATVVQRFTYPFGVSSATTSAATSHDIFRGEIGSIYGTSVYADPGFLEGNAAVVWQRGSRLEWQQFQYQSEWGVEPKLVIHVGENRAQELLKEMIAEVDFRNYQDKGYIDLQGDSGIIYRVWKDKMVDIYMDKTKIPLLKLENHPDGSSYKRMLLKSALDNGGLIMPKQPKKLILDAVDAEFEVIKTAEKPKLFKRLCIHPDRNKFNIPPTDEVIQKIFLIKNDERRFLETAHLLN